jgi:hypothetical protein
VLGRHPGRSERRRPADKAEIYSQLGLRLTYQPGQRIVRAEAHLDQTPHWTVSEGGLEPFAYAQVLSAEFAIEDWS